MESERSQPEGEKALVKEENKSERSVVGELLEQLPNEREGINHERVESFFHEMGFETHPTLYINDASVEAYASELSRYGWQTEVRPQDEDEMAVHQNAESLRIHHHDGRLEQLNVVYRDRTEQRNGTLYSEGIAVHEMAHATAQENKRSGSGFKIVRSDNDGLEGQFFEEAFADVLRAKYIGKHGQGTFSLLLKEKGHLRSDALEQKLTMRNSETNLSYRAPLRYFFVGKEGTLRLSHPSIAAVGMELLCERNPRLMPALLKARSSIEGLREVARIINEIQPGLYTKLRRLQYSLKDFEAGLAMILAAVGTAEDPAPVSKSEETAQ